MEDQTLAKIRILVLQTFINVDAGFSKTEGQNSMGTDTKLYGRCCWCTLFIFLNRIIQRPLVEDQTLAKIRILVHQTFVYVDEGFSKTVGQNSMGTDTTIIWKVSLMHVFQIFKSEHSAPPGGRLNLSQNLDFGTLDLSIVWVESVGKCCHLWS